MQNEDNPNNMNNNINNNNNLIIRELSSKSIFEIYKDLLPSVLFVFIKI